MSTSQMFSNSNNVNITGGSVTSASIGVMYQAYFQSPPPDSSPQSTSQDPNVLLLVNLEHPAIHTRFPKFAPKNRILSTNERVRNALVKLYTNQHCIPDSRIQECLSRWEIMCQLEKKLQGKGVIACLSQEFRETLDSYVKMGRELYDDVDKASKAGVVSKMREKVGATTPQ